MKKRNKDLRNVFGFIIHKKYSINRQFPKHISFTSKEFHQNGDWQTYGNTVEVREQQGIGKHAKESPGREDRNWKGPLSTNERPEEVNGSKLLIISAERFWNIFCLYSRFFFFRIDANSFKITWAEKFDEINDRCRAKNLNHKDQE